MKGRGHSDGIDHVRGVSTLSRKQVRDRIRRRESLRDQDMRALDLSGLCFDELDVRRAKLAEANLTGSTFRGADLSEASLWHAKLRDVVFDGANLEGADLDTAILDGATFRGAKIRRAIFPCRRVSLSRIQQSVRTGSRVYVKSASVDKE